VYTFLNIPKLSVTNYVILYDKLLEICHLTNIVYISQSNYFATISIGRLYYTSRHLFIVVRSLKKFFSSVRFDVLRALCIEKTVLWL
jgi:hypothetical protein